VAPAAPATAAAAHAPTETLSPEAAAELAQLEAQVEAAPGDLAARRRLALALVANNRLLDAYDQAEQILLAQPDEPDALYVEAEVRIAMGQGTKAIELLDRVLAKIPDHVPALTARGKALAGLGRPAEAVATWERALAAAGGHDPELQRLIAGVRGGGVPGAPG
jgi:tetratricopeptide (TPR) repeat protein